MNRRIEAQTAELLKKHDLYSFPIAVEDLARAEGIKIARTPFKGTQSGFALSQGEVRVIGVNSLTSRRRQRFTIAHELGHLVLHSKDLIIDHSVRVNWRDERSSMGTDREEVEANAFAAELLMPQRAVREAVNDLVRRGVSAREEIIATLGTSFDVSQEAMGFRLINLGVFPA